jgi:hypothetical protein
MVKLGEPYGRVGVSPSDPTRSHDMNIKMIAAGLAATMAISTAATGANAGCLGGAVVGGVGGHFAGHHTLLGAAAGCAVGHHMAVMKKRRMRAARGY